MVDPGQCNAKLLTRHWLKSDGEPAIPGEILYDQPVEISLLKMGQGWAEVTQD